MQGCHFNGSVGLKGGRWLLLFCLLPLAVACSGDYSGEADPVSDVADPVGGGTGDGAADDGSGAGDGGDTGDSGTTDPGEAGGDDGASGAGPDLDNGKRQYAQHCANCHGDRGEGGIGPAMTPAQCPTCVALETLIPEIHDNMPSSNPSRCIDACAEDVAQYIWEGFPEDTSGGAVGDGQGGSGSGDAGGDAGEGGGDAGGDAGGEPGGDTGSGDGSGDGAGDDGSGQDGAGNGTGTGDGGDGGETAPEPTCSVEMRFQSNWNVGFVTEVIIRNFSGAPIDGWEVAFTFDNGQQITNAWNTDLVQSGAGVSARHVDYNSQIDDGAETTFGFQGEHGGTNDMPSDVRLIAEGCITANNSAEQDTGDGGQGGDPGDGGGEPLACADNPGASRVLRLLTRREYSRSITDLTGLTTDFTADFPVEARVSGYDNNAHVAVVTSRHVDQYLAAGAVVAEQAVAQRQGALLEGCSSGDACLHAFIDRFGRRAFRRPLTTAERDAYRDLNRDELTGGDFDTAMELIIQAILTSPNFLYRAEIGTAAGNGVYLLSDYEIATAMSYLLWGSTPDDALLQAAEEGSLSTSSGRLAQAERLMQDARAREQVADFAEQWMGAYQILEQFKDEEIYPRFNDTVRESMAEEFTRFVTHVVFDSAAGTLDELYTADYAFLNGVLREFYRQPGSTSDPAFSQQTVTDGTRGGILSTGALLASHAHSNESSPIKRGVFVRERLLCQDLPDPPQDVDTTPPGLDPSLTTRERFRQHTDDPNCAGCHQYIDGIGFGFERYDGVGDYRSTENGQNVDDSGEVVDIEGFRTETNDPFFGTRQLGTLLANSPAAQDCAVTQYYRYARGYAEGEADACVLEDLTQSFRDSGFDLRTMLMDLIAHPSFVRRTAGGDA